MSEEPDSPTGERLPTLSVQLYDERFFLRFEALSPDIELFVQGAGYQRSAWLTLSTPARRAEFARRLRACADSIEAVDAPERPEVPA